MIVAIDKAGGLGILSRQISLSYEDEINSQLAEISIAIERGANNIGCAIGIKNAPEKTKRLVCAGCKVICLDVAHCDHSLAHRAISEMVSYRKDSKKKFVIMAGNVCTKEATKRLIKLGVDAIKVGVGPGAVCTTRNVTGFGVPQLSAIMECCKENNQRLIKDRVSIVADGGIRFTGDMVKSLWGGADACMVGYMLAGTSCTPDLGIPSRKKYRGMSSRNVSGRSDVAPEGINIDVEYGGETGEKLLSFAQSIKSGLAMGGCRNISELRDYVKANRISVASLKESSTL